MEGGHALHRQGRKRCCRARYTASTAVAGRPGFMCGCVQRAAASECLHLPGVICCAQAGSTQEGADLACLWCALKPLGQVHGQVPAALEPAPLQWTVGVQLVLRMSQVRCLRGRGQAAPP